MLLRAIVAFLALPGVVAFVIPLFVAHESQLPAQFGVVAIALLCCGLACLAWCVWAFYTSGKGTLAPWSPPRHLVSHGLYQYSRNPMYWGVLLLLVGWSVLYRSAALAWYAAAVAVAFHLRVVFGEEPWLAQVHGQEWQSYKNKVNRWLGRCRQSPQGDA